MKIMKVGLYGLLGLGLYIGIISSFIQWVLNVIWEVIPTDTFVNQVLRIVISFALYMALGVVTIWMVDGARKQK